MKCEDCLSILEEYFDAELDGRQSEKVAAHLTACVSCNEVYAVLEQEQQLYAHYERDVEVTPLLWQGVQARISQEAARQETSQPIGVVERLRKFFTESFHAPRFSPALATALVVVAVGATVLVMTYMNSRSNTTNIADGTQNNSGADSTKNVNENKVLQPNTPEVAGGGVKPENRDESTQTPSITPQENNPEVVRPIPVKASPDAMKQRGSLVAKGLQPNVSAESLLRDAEQKYLAAIAILQRDFDKRRSKLDPKLLAKLDASLASIDRTIAETRKAVRQNSDDPIAVQYMLTAYAKKVEVLRDVTAN